MGPTHYHIYPAEGSVKLQRHDDAVPGEQHAVVSTIAQANDLTIYQDGGTVPLLSFKSRTLAAGQPKLIVKDVIGGNEIMCDMFTFGPVDVNVQAAPTGNVPGQPQFGGAALSPVHGKATAQPTGNEPAAGPVPNEPSVGAPAPGSVESPQVSGG